jgi:hypothetical protein
VDASLEQLPRRADLPSAWNSETVTHLPGDENGPDEAAEKTAPE